MIGFVTRVMVGIRTLSAVICVRSTHASSSSIIPIFVVVSDDDGFAYSGNS
jgi:hypothetical protein